MIEDLKNKVVLITGSSTGIGAAAAKAFGATGARVAVHYNKSKSEAEKVAAEIEKVRRQGFPCGRRRLRLRWYARIW